MAFEMDTWRSDMCLLPDWRTGRHWDAVVDELMGAPVSSESGGQLQRLYVAFEVGSGGVREDA